MCPESWLDLGIKKQLIDLFVREIFKTDSCYAMVQLQFIAYTWVYMGRH